jgi:STE24 endopeptidase
VDIQRCPHCHFRIYPSREGVCPSCAKNVHDDPAPRRLEFVVESGSSDTDLYQREALRCNVVAILLEVACLTTAVLAAPLLDAWLVRSAGVDFAALRCLLINLSALVFFALVFSYLNYYSGFVLDRRFGMGKVSAGRWFNAYLRGTISAIVVRSVILTGLYLFILATGFYWWFWATALSAIRSAWEACRTPTRFGIHKNRIKQVSDWDVVEMAIKLLEGTGFYVEDVCEISVGDDTIRPNAYLWGVGSSRRLLVTDTLVKGFEPDEIRVILAHEVGHVVYRHIPKQLAIYAARNCLGYYLCDLVFHWWFNQSGNTFDYTLLPPHAVAVYLFVIGVWFLVTWPFIASIHRHFERQCDRYALRRCGSAGVYRSAMMKLARFNRLPMNSHSWDVLLFQAHPAMADRIAIAEMQE